MSAWEPEERWKGQDCFVIGGGSSLREFDWTRLYAENTIGCNDAFKHGVDVCKVCVFGDRGWWDAYEEDLAKYNGLVVTNIGKCAAGAPTWVKYMEREPFGFHRNALGWNGHTGSVAINLAFLFGVKRIFLLGFDMGRGEHDKSNWHDDILHPSAVLPESYELFLSRWDEALKSWHEDFSDVEIYNVTDRSALYGIPQLRTKIFWERRLHGMAASASC